MGEEYEEVDEVICHGSLDSGRHHQLGSAVVMLTL